MQARMIVPVALLIAGSAAADLTDAGTGGFTTTHEVVVDTDRAAAWDAAVNEVGEWWHSDHTVSGDASNMSIDARPNGCFCESLGKADAGVVHLNVTMVNPTIVLRLTGGLGPLGLMGVSGNMTWEFADREDGDGTAIKFTYAVGGYRDGGLDTIAEPVDYVIGEALQRLKAHIETGNAESAVLE